MANKYRAKLGNRTLYFNSLAKARRWFWKQRGSGFVENRKTKKVLSYK
jgi:hypothetical protein